MVIATDLFLTESNRIDPLPITPDEIAEVIDISFIAHWHGDHFNEYTTKILLEKSQCLIVMPESCLPTAEKINIPEERIIIAKPGESFEVMGVVVDALRAIPLIITLIVPSFVFGKESTTSNNIINRSTICL